MQRKLAPPQLGDSPYLHAKQAGRVIGCVRVCVLVSTGVRQRLFSTLFAPLPHPTPSLSFSPSLPSLHFAVVCEKVDSAQNVSLLLLCWRKWRAGLKIHLWERGQNIQKIKHAHTHKHTGLYLLVLFHLCVSEEEVGGGTQCHLKRSDWRHGLRKITPLVPACVCVCVL